MFISKVSNVNSHSKCKKLSQKSNCQTRENNLSFGSLPTDAAERAKLLKEAFSEGFEGHFSNEMMEKLDAFCKKEQLAYEEITRKLSPTPECYARTFDI